MRVRNCSTEKKKRKHLCNAKQEEQVELILCSNWR